MGNKLAVEAGEQEDISSWICFVGILWTTAISDWARNGRCQRCAVQHARGGCGSMAGQEDCLVVTVILFVIVIICRLYAVPANEFFLGIIEPWPFKMLPTTPAVKLVFVFHRVVAPWTHGKGVPVLINPYLGYGLWNALCVGEKQVDNKTVTRRANRRVYIAFIKIEEPWCIFDEFW